jgi:hypothetical protein
VALSLSQAYDVKGKLVGLKGQLQTPGRAHFSPSGDLTPVKAPHSSIIQHVAWQDKGNLHNLAR